MKRGIIAITCFCFAAAIFFPALSHPAGFGIFTQGASPLGQADSVTAHTDSPSAVFFNPALITKLGGTHVETGTTLLIPKRDFRSDLTGKKFSTEHEVFFPPTFFLTHQFTEKMTAGFGVFSPFGLSTKWDDDWEGRYIATDSEIETIAFNPAIAVKLTPSISVAAGVNLLLLDATLEKKLNVAPLGLPDINQKFDGDGTGVGFNAGLTVDLGKDVSAGISYRSKIKVDIGGDVSHDSPALADPALSSLFPSTGADTNLTLPPIMTVGVSFRPTEKSVVEAGVRWEGWSTIDVLKFELDEPVAGATSLRLKKNWNDTYTFMIGGDYSLSENISIRAGYLYGTNPVPRNTFDPSIPDANTHFISFGTGLKLGKIRLDLAYAYQKLIDRDKNNSVDDIPDDGFLNPATSANGRYRSDLHIIGASISYSF
jgi:long-chain fatty acid transport protein